MDTDKLLSVTKKLLACEYPFRWKPQNDLETYPDDMLDRISLKIKEKSIETESVFELTMLYILLGYEYYVNDAVSDSMKTFETAEVMLKSSKDDLLLQRLSIPILHIILSSKAYILTHAKELERAYEISSEIPVISPNDTKDMATLIGLRGVFCSEYGIFGSKMGLKYATEANIIDPEESLWCFLKGKYLGRIRRVEKPFDIPTLDEVKVLEQAMKLEQNASYTVFTAQLYRETANRTFRLHKKSSTVFPLLKKKLDELNEESLKLYERSIKLKPNCVHMMFRCAKGLMALPVPFRNDAEAKKLLKKGLALSPNSAYGNHMMAQYYERREQNFELAMWYLEKCRKYKVFGACMDLLRLEYKKDPTGIEDKLMKMLDDFHEPVRRCQILSQLTSYHIFTSHNLPKACEYINKCIRIDAKRDDMFQHRPLTVATFDTLNLYDIIVDEIKIQLLDKNCSLEHRETYEATLNNCRETGIHVTTQLPQYLKKQIVDKVNSFKKSTCKKPKTQGARYNFTARSYKPTQQQPLSWRNRNQMLETEQLKKIEEITSVWKEKCATKEERFDTTNRNKNRSDDEKDDEDSDVALQASIYAKTAKTKKSESNRNRVSEDDDSDVHLQAQIFEKTGKLKENNEKMETKEEMDELESLSPEETNRLSSSLRQMRLTEGSNTSSAEDDDALSVRSQKMRVNMDHGRLKTRESVSYHRKDINAEDDFDQYVLAYRKTKGKQARSNDLAPQKSWRNSHTAKKVAYEERYSNKTYQSVSSKSGQNTGRNKYVGASDRDSGSHSDSDVCNRNRGRCSSRRESSYERKSSKSKHSRTSDRERDYGDDYRRSKSKDRDYDSKTHSFGKRHMFDRKCQTENRHREKEKSKREAKRDSSCSDDAELMAILKEVATDFKPGTIGF